MRRLLLALVLLLAPSPALAQEAPVPEGVKTIDADGLKALLAGGGKVLLANTLSPLEFTQTKIAGSVSIPYGHLRDGKRALPDDKDTTLVFYCLGPK